MGHARAAVVVIDDQGRVLLHRRQSSPHEMSPWCVFQSEARNGEDLVDALGIAIAKELGVTGLDLTEVLAVPDAEAAGQQIRMFAGQWSSDLSALNSDAQRELRFVDPARLHELEMSPALRDAILHTAYEQRWWTYNKRMDPRLALVVLTNQIGRLLLHRRPDTAATWPGVWSMFGAAARPGETMSSALERELRAEGIEATDLRDLFLVRDETTGRNVAVFSGRWTGHDPAVLPGHATGDVTLVDVESVGNLPMPPQAREALLRALALHGPTSGWDVWDRQSSLAVIPFPPAPSEKAFADRILDHLAPHFHIEREVAGTHCSGRPMRIDAVLKPRAPSGWKDDAPVFGIEFKIPPSPYGYGLDPASIAQAIDYTHTDWVGYGRLMVALCPPPIMRTKADGGHGHRVLLTLLAHLGLAELLWLNGYGLSLVKHDNRLLWTERTGVHEGRRWTIEPGLGNRH